MMRFAIVGLLALLVLLTSCCQSTQSPADVAAERARWQSIQTTTSDRVIDEAEATLLAELLIVWDQKIKLDEAAVGARQRTPQETLTELLRVYGPAMVQVALGDELLKRAPELFRFIDKDENGALDHHELLAIDPLDPVFAIVVTSTAARLIRGEK